MALERWAIARRITFGAVSALFPLNSAGIAPSFASVFVMAANRSSMDGSYGLMKPYRLL